MDCDARCNDDSAPLALGIWDGETIVEIDGPRAMEYGPQGGQHFFIDAQILVPLEDRLRLDVEFVDESTGERTGAARWQENVEGCGHVITNIPVVMLEPVEQSGSLEVAVTLGACEWEFDLSDVEVREPGFEEAEVENGSDAPDGG